MRQFPKAVIFDMDGLLLDTERIALETYNEAAADLGIEAGRDLFERFVGRTWEHTRLLMVDVLGPVDGGAMLERWPETFDRRLEQAPIPKKPGADAILRMLAGRGTPLALATSSHRDKTTLSLASSELDGYFSTITTGDEIAAGKPAPDIFLLASKRIRVHPRSCLVLEDSEPGVRAAHAAGIPVIMVPDLHQPSYELAALASRIHHSLAEVQAFLESLPAG